ncbi:MAG TPA: fumarylacetoacetate hydrolase family protein [Anaerohalosphaeraceae bacterium]|nr:fumarylacetoacetate hydrolase family protein [Anaerohalosphaeraceae bacterium]HOL31656.1 fumarylacetoacetate hydrolase family protein [Anaerohalosphaeraceae bacterium]HOM75395.1 fumarylacetoacetate hydrolase family protein [Anaerohalosphaeraceae bacterium]HPC63284.1 fumarylacetoacetate hydrolase family protein [Anaerohalosphaeraceae bacterium]HPO69586.1 fumarylacetoacetate hydrolase family protein [Anaerohalosphaeraceae bacterium]
MFGDVLSSKRHCFLKGNSMKLATYDYHHAVSCGILTNEGFIDIPSHTQGAKRLHSVKEILIKGQKALEILQELQHSVQERIKPDHIKLRAPIPHPGKVIGLAGNYKKHLEETAWQDGTFDDQAVKTNPWPFLMPASVITGHQTVIPWPVYSQQIDYEIELAVFIGDNASKITPQQALSYIAGYSIANDISARSVTFKQGRKERPRDVFFDWMMGKWADGFLPLGPWLVTADEINDPQNLDMELKVNGQTRQKANTSQMIFTIAQIVSFISHLMTLEPGDVIITGTPHGVAAADGSYLHPGDIVECTIQHLGTLTNTIGAKPDNFYRAFI